LYNRFNPKVFSILLENLIKQNVPGILHY